mmetsp:Transcript_153645/g.268698  ORF Transcript_153645/g.268698 Transcript_153645/m.268698 type:complete len:220 (-) Transcript_153645:1255-1914(-)
MRTSASALKSSCSRVTSVAWAAASCSANCWTFRSSRRSDLLAAAVARSRCALAAACVLSDESCTCSACCRRQSASNCSSSCSRVHVVSCSLRSATVRAATSASCVLCDLSAARCASAAAFSALRASHLRCHSRSAFRAWLRASCSLWAAAKLVFSRSVRAISSSFSTERRATRRASHSSVRFCCPVSCPSTCRRRRPHCASSSARAAACASSAWAICSL